MSPTQKLLIVAAVAVAALLLWLRSRAPSGAGTNAPQSAPATVAFVLLREAQLPTGEALTAALRGRVDLVKPVACDTDTGVVTLEPKQGGGVLAMLLPGPIPDGEAEAASARSLGAYLDQGTIAEHTAHLIVTYSAAPPMPVTERLRLFTRIVAALTEASDAIGVYWGGGEVAHTAAFFRDAAGAEDLPLGVWIGLSIVATGEDRASVLGFGMEQFDLPNLLLTCPSTEMKDGLAYYFDLLAYVLSRGAPLAAGDTVGRTAQEKLSVRYAPSPLDANTQVWCVDLP